MLEATKALRPVVELDKLAKKVKTMTRRHTALQKELLDIERAHKQLSIARMSEPRGTRKDMLRATEVRKKSQQHQKQRARHAFENSGRGVQPSWKGSPSSYARLSYSSVSNNHITNRQEWEELRPVKSAPAKWQKKEGFSLGDTAFTPERLALKDKLTRTANQKRIKKLIQKKKRAALINAGGYKGRAQWQNSPSTFHHLTFSSTTNRTIRNLQEIPHLHDQFSMPLTAKKRVKPSREAKRLRKLNQQREAKWAGNPHKYRQLSFSSSANRHIHNPQEIPMDPAPLPSPIQELYTQHQRQQKSRSKSERENGLVDPGIQVIMDQIMAAPAVFEHSMVSSKDHLESLVESKEAQTKEDQTKEEPSKKLSLPLKEITVGKIGNRNISFKLTLDGPFEDISDTFNTQIREFIAHKLSITIEAVSINSVTSGSVVVVFSLSVPALLVVGLLQQTEGEAKEEEDASAKGVIKVKLKTLKNMVKKTSAKVQQTQADLKTLRDMLAEHDQRSGNVDHKHSRNDMVEGIQALETTLQYADEELQQYKDALEKATQTPNRKQSDNVKKKLAAAVTKLEQIGSEADEKIGHPNTIRLVV